MLTQAVLRAGLVTEAQIAEMKRWAPPSLSADDVPEEPKSLAESVALINDALQSDGYVLMRETDLEAVRQYAATSQRSILHLEPEGVEAQDIEVTYGKTPIGEYIIAWHSESIQDLLTNGLTYLVVRPTDGSVERVFFKDVRELFFGTTKAFMVCVPSSVEHAPQ
jgi:hypothetical protein